MIVLADGHADHFIGIHPNLCLLCAARKDGFVNFLQFQDIVCLELESIFAKDNGGNGRDRICRCVIGRGDDQQAAVILFEPDVEQDSAGNLPAGNGRCAAGPETAGENSTGCRQRDICFNGIGAGIDKKPEKMAVIFKPGGSQAGCGRSAETVGRNRKRIVGNRREKRSGTKYGTIAVFTADESPVFLTALVPDRFRDILKRALAGEKRCDCVGMHFAVSAEDGDIRFQ